MTGSKYLSELVSLDMLKMDKLNIIKSPTGSGKTYFALTAVPEALEDAYHRVVYLIDTINGKEQILQNYNATVYSSYWENEVLSQGEMGYYQSQKVVIMTYAKFGLITSKNLNFPSIFDYIICDELPSTVKFEMYDRGINSHSLAISGIESAVRNDKTTVIALTATPYLIGDRFDVPLYTVPIDEDELRRYETGQCICYNSIDSILPTLDKTKTGLCYCYHIRTMKKLEAKARELGFHPISIWSIRNQEHPLNEEQLAVRESILRKSTLPPEYNLLFINASSETSLKIKSPIDYAIINSFDEDTQIQVRGRINSDLPLIYLPSNTIVELYVPEKFLFTWLFKKDRDKLCKSIALRNKNNRLYGWPTLKRHLEGVGYTVTRGRWNNCRYYVILPPEDEYGVSSGKS